MPSRVDSLGDTVVTCLVIIIPSTHYTRFRFLPQDLTSRPVNNCPELSTGIVSRFSSSDDVVYLMVCLISCRSVNWLCLSIVSVVLLC